jgi:uncharacterized protein (TIGR00730 family)
MMTLEHAPEEARQTLMQAAPWPTVRRTQRVAVFAGSACGYDDVYLAGARALGQEIAARRLELVYGGTGGGLMGAVADTVREQGGRVIGVVPAGVWPHLHDCSSPLEQVGSIHARVERMLALADAVIVLPGGVGTLHELFAALAAAETGERRTLVGLYDLQGYFAPLVALLKHCQTHGFLHQSAEGLRHLRSASEPTEILDAVLGVTRWLPHQAPPLPAQEVQ